MSTLNSDSTNAQVWAAFDDNASFEEDASATKAAAFVTACRILLRRMPRRMDADGQMAEFNTAFIQSELQRASRYVAAAGSAAGGGARKYFDFGDCRE